MSLVVLIVFAIILGIITAVFYKLGRVIPRSSKSSLIWISILTVFIVILLYIIIAVNITEYNVGEEKLDHIIEGTIPLVKSSKTQLDEHPFANLFWIDLKYSKENIGDQVEEAIKMYQQNLGFSQLPSITSSYGKSLASLINLIRNNIREFKHFDWLNLDDVPYPLYNIQSTMQPILDNVQSSMNNINQMKNDMSSLVAEQQKLDIDKSVVKEKMMIMRNMINQFQIDINKMETTRKDWIQKMRESATFWITENITKLLVTITCIILIILSIISIITLYRPSLFGQKNPSKIISILFCITAILTTISGLIVLIVSTKTLGHFDCPLKNDTFGVANFTIADELPGNYSLSICKTSDSTFFASILPLISRENIIKNLEVKEYKKKLREKFISLSALNMPTSLSYDLVQVEKFRVKLELMIRQCRFRQCSQPLHEQTLNLLVSVMEDSNNIRTIYENFAVKLQNQENTFNSRIDYLYENVVSSFVMSIDIATRKVVAADFECDSLVASFSTVGYDICKKYDSPLDTYLIYLLITILICCISLILFSSIYNSLKIINEDLKSDSKSPALTPTE